MSCLFLSECGEAWTLHNKHSEEATESWTGRPASTLESEEQHGNVLPGFFFLLPVFLKEPSQQTKYPKTHGKKPNTNKAAPNEGSGEGPQALQDETLKNGNHSIPARLPS